MNKVKKTYGAKGLVEWQARIPAGKSHLTINFSGGTVTAYGITPAIYATDNPVFQAIIEHSAYWREGKIILVRSVELDAEETRVQGTPAEIKETLIEPGQETAKEPDAKTVSVTSRQDAVDYLHDNFGVPVRDLRSKANISAIAKDKGIVFEGLD